MEGVYLFVRAARKFSRVKGYLHFHSIFSINYVLLDSFPQMRTLPPNAQQIVTSRHFRLLPVVGLRHYYEVSVPLDLSLPLLTMTCNGNVHMITQKRYTRQWLQVLSRRALVPEKWLAGVLASAGSCRGSARAAMIVIRLAEEQAELKSYETLSGHHGLSSEEQVCCSKMWPAKTRRK